MLRMKILVASKVLSIPSTVRGGFNSFSCYDPGHKSIYKNVMKAISTNDKYPTQRNTGETMNMFFSFESVSEIPTQLYNEISESGGTKEC